jgi:hypothetical protein
MEEAVLTKRLLKTLHILTKKFLCITEMMTGNVITHESPRDYKQAVAYTLAQDYGFTRIMSSYYFTNTDQGPPNNGGYRCRI